MKEIIATGKTIDEATENGLSQMKAAREEVEVEPLQTGSKGFLGIGRKPAEVRITLRPDDRIRTTVFMKNILDFMKIETEMKIQEDEENIEIVLGEEAAPLIGHRGQTLDSLQYLVARYLNEDRDEWTKVVIDIDNYRDRREENLRGMAERMAEQVARNKRDLRTEPLTAPERRIIHMTLKENRAVSTFSIGEGTRKRVVIATTDRNADSRRRGSGGGRRGGRSGGGGGRSGGRPGGDRSGGGRSGGGRSDGPPRRGGGGGGGGRRRPPRHRSESN